MSVQKFFTWSPSIPTSSPWGSKVALVPELKTGNRIMQSAINAKEGRHNLE